LCFLSLFRQVYCLWLRQVLFLVQHRHYVICLFWRRHDTQHKDIHLNDTQHNNLIRDTQHNDTQHNVVDCYSECHLCSVSIMLSVQNKPIMLSVILLSVIMLSVVVPHWHNSLVNSMSAVWNILKKSFYQCNFKFYCKILLNLT
jgi:hypothetical protein